MKASQFLLCVFLYFIHFSAQAQSPIIYKTIKPSFYNNFKITFSLKHNLTFKKRLMLIDHVDSTHLAYDIHLLENDSKVKLGRLHQLIELNDSQVLLKGRCFVKKIDYEMPKMVYSNPSHYRIKKNNLIRHLSYDSISRFKLFKDSLETNFVQYTELNKSYILDKNLIKTCTVTNLNIWVKTQKEARKKKRQHYIKTFVTLVGGTYILIASAVGITYGIIVGF